MKKLAIIVFLLFATIYVAWIWKTHNLTPEIQYIKKPIGPEVVGPPIQGPASGPQADPNQWVIDEINNRNALIQTMNCEVAILASQEVTVRLNADVYFEKPNNFRMKTYSFVGLETDIGSNNQHFWFWSKRLDPPALYYGKHENVHKSGLRTPFNPKWVMELLSIIQIEQNEQSRLSVYDEKYLALVEPRISTTGLSVQKITLIDPNQQAIIGHYLLGANNRMILSCEIAEYHYVNQVMVPKKMKIIWHEENVVLLWSISEVRINESLDSNNWILPDRRQKIELGENNQFSATFSW